MKIKVTFLEPILGSLPGNKELLAEHIASKAPDQEKADEEIASVVEETEKMTTVFARDENGLFVWDYHWRGYFKDNLKTLAEMGEAGQISIWTAGRAVDKFLYVAPRRIYFARDGQPICEPEGYLDRSLRATTLRGDRICLARSQVVKAGATMLLGISWLMGEKITKSKVAAWDKELVESILNLGRQSGWGQWRSGGNGRFEWKEVE